MGETGPKVISTHSVKSALCLLKFSQLYRLQHKWDSKRIKLLIYQLCSFTGNLNNSNLFHLLPTWGYLWSLIVWGFAWLHGDRVCHVNLFMSNPKFTKDHQNSFHGFGWGVIVTYCTTNNVARFLLQIPQRLLNTRNTWVSWFKWLTQTFLSL